MSATDPKKRHSESHAESQANRILDAAEQCFIEYGFHAASMANISKQANMSPGLIYRYFESKNAIILAIIDRQLKERRADIKKMQAELDLAGRILELFDCWTKADPGSMNPALFLEMSAEASRNQQLGEALSNSDKLSRASFHDWLRRRAAAKGFEVPETEIRTRALALQCFIEGLVLRAVREKDHDLETLDACINLFITDLLTFKPG